MAVEFVALPRTRKAELRGFLLSVFQGESISLRPDLLDWKYFDDHPWWSGSRSCVLEKNGAIVAHGGVSPVRYACGGAISESMQVVDWAANGEIPGAGLLVYRKCLEIGGGTLLAIGGSEDTHRLIPQVKWFSRKSDLRYYARPLRAWKLRRPGLTAPRNLARVASRLRWQLPPLPGAGAWSCVNATPDRVFQEPAMDIVAVWRTQEWFEYLLRCPSVRVRFVALERGGERAGHALLADAGGSVRIADFVIAERWTAERAPALSAVIRYVRESHSAVEAVAASTLEELWPVYEACGMRWRGSDPVYLADPKKIFPANARVEVNPLIGDAYSFFVEEWPFRC